MKKEKTKDLKEELYHYKKEHQYQKAMLIQIGDIIDAYKHNQYNPYTALRDITNIIKQY